MFGLTCDFIQRDGICMVLDEPEGLPAGKLNMVQLRMMLTANIPNHLRLYLKEIDLKVKLEYSISGKRMLSHLLKSEKLRMGTFFGILLQVAQGLEEGRLYMLEPERYALHEDYIFIDGTLQNGRVYLTYVPLTNQAPSAKPGECLKSLIMVLMASITELKGDGVQRLLHYCGEEGFTSSGLKKLLAELLTEGNEGVERPQGNQPLSPVQIDAGREQAAEARRTQEKEPQRTGIERIRPALPPESKTQQSPWMNGGFPSIQSNERISGLASPPNKNDHKKSPSSSKTYIVMGCILGAALSWKFLYLNHPEQLWLIVCGIVTLLLAAVCVMAWRGLIGSDEREEDDEEEQEVSLFNNARTPALPRLDFGQRELHTSRTNPPRHDPVVAIAKQEMPSISVSVPAPTAPTTLLSRDKAPGSGQAGAGENSRRAGTPYLERCEEAGEVIEKIELNRPSFVIGRSTEVAQYIERSDGTSRVHAEVSKSGGGYVLKDLDSRNGTLFQGEAMIPYKEYRLADGDVFTIVKGSYTFRTA